MSTPHARLVDNDLNEAPSDAPTAAEAGTAAHSPSRPHAAALVDAVPSPVRREPSSRGKSSAQAHGEPSARGEEAQDEQPVPQVAILPSGEMVYLSKDNPYAQAYAEHSSDHNGYDPRQDDPYAVPMPPSLLATFEQPLVLERMGRIVRLLAMFDLIFSLMNVLSRMWPAAITAVMAYCGYVGARMFRRDLTRVYLFYLIFIAVVRISVSVKWSIEPDVATSAQVFLIISSALQLVIAHFVWRFYSLLPTTEEESRFVQFVAEHQAGRGLV